MATFEKRGSVVGEDSLGRTPVAMLDVVSVTAKQEEVPQHLRAYECGFLSERGGRCKVQLNLRCPAPSCLESHVSMVRVSVGRKDSEVFRADEAKSDKTV